MCFHLINYTFNDYGSTTDVISNRCFTDTVFARKMVCVLIGLVMLAQLL